MLISINASQPAPRATYPSLSTSLSLHSGPTASMPSRTGGALVSPSVDTQLGSRWRMVSSATTLLHPLPLDLAVTSFIVLLTTGGLVNNADLLRHILITLSLITEPRLALGIPIIGSPSVLDLLSHRAANLPAPHGPLPVAAPYFPTSLLRLIERDDPINVPRSGWKGRKILVLSGGADELVNYVHGATDRFVEVLKGKEGVGKDGVVDVWVQEGT